jgi:hypothetical protein
MFRPALLVLACLIAYPATALELLSISPARNALEAPTTAPIQLGFDGPVKPASLNSDTFKVFGRWSGPAPGTFTFINGGRTISFKPTNPFSAGERVMVVLSHDIEGVDDSFLRQAGYCWQFWTRVKIGSLNFENIQTINTSEESESGVTYGGLGSDLNGDGHLDLGMVMEESADFRVFLNNADNSGTFQTPYLTPSPLGNEASPNEPSDFNNDGIIDVCVVVSDTTPPYVSVLQGKGDGSFEDQQIIDVSNTPHGLAVLDVDGDGDMDIASTNDLHAFTKGANDGSVSLLINNGSGVFSAPMHYEAGIDGERAIAAADMNNDGILDLVVGSRFDTHPTQSVLAGSVIVNLGNGDGTFTPQTPIYNTGSLWMLTTGDVNGDGNEDVVCANSGDDDGSSVLLGNGAGGLSILYKVRHTQVGTGDNTAAADRTNAVDLADLDGDGVLEWIISSFGGRFWRIFENNGLGNPNSFTLLTHFNAPMNAACAIALDTDNDRDLDLALIEEIEDMIFVNQNPGVSTDVNTSGSTNIVDLQIAVNAILQFNVDPFNPDIDGSGTTTVIDLFEIVETILEG